MMLGHINMKDTAHYLRITDDDIANEILKLPIWDKTYFHVFLPIEEQKEVNTEFILHLLSGKDKEIVISKSDFATREMTHFLLTDNTKIKKNEYNIPEPVDGLEVPATKIDVVFVPLLAYDQKGNRVGYGKGFYDRLYHNTGGQLFLQNPMNHSSACL